MRDGIRGAVLGFIATAMLLAGCPATCQGPTPGPDAVDAAPPPIPPRPAPDCITACQHADVVCPGSKNPCTNACNRIGADYATCAGGLAAGVDACHALNNCDPLNVLNDPSSAARPHGR